MTKTVSPGMGTQTFDAILQPKMGDREDFKIRVVGPDPGTNFEVPLSITGTALAIWGSPSPVEAAETLGAAIFHQVGTASQPPKEGYWFDSYNSGENLRDTVNKIYNSDTSPFIKNWPGSFYVKSLGSDILQKMQELDELFSQKFNTPFFKSLEDLSEESQRVDDLNTPAKNNAEFLYQVCILSGVIDHINVRTQKEDEHLCSSCGQRHKQLMGSLQDLKGWLTDKLNPSEADRLTETFQMIKKLRKQYPIHDHYTTANNIRQERKEIAEAKMYFGLIDKDFNHNSAVVTSKFGDAIKNIMKAFDLQAIP